MALADTKDISTWRLLDAVQARVRDWRAGEHSVTQRLGQYAVGTLRHASKKLATHFKAGRNMPAASKPGGAL